MTAKAFRCTVCLSFEVKQVFSHGGERGRKTRPYGLKCRDCGNREESIHGRNWKTFEKASRDSTPRASGCAGAEGKASPKPFTTTVRASSSSRAGKSAGLSWADLQQQIIGKTIRVRLPSNFKIKSSVFFQSVPEIEPDYALETCAPEVGEIQAWRVWRLEDGLLHSLVAEQIWHPGEVVEGELEKWYDTGHWVPGGVYAWKHRQAALGQASTYAFHEALGGLRYFVARKMSAPDTMLSQKEFLPEPRAFVIGRVKLWGNVIEHEKGFRAERARISALEEVFARPSLELDSLRRDYGLEESDGV